MIRYSLARVVLGMLSSMSLLLCACQPAPVVPVVQQEGLPAATLTVAVPATATVAPTVPVGAGSPTVGVATVMTIPLTAG